MRVLSGIQPSGQLHIGNYFGAIAQMLRLQEDHELFAFIANYHALSGGADLNQLRQNTLDVAIDFLALGIDPDKTVFWVQSSVKEVLELYWILSRYTPVGLLERAHSYKDKVAKGIAPSHALFSYPVLMAADILLYDAQKVPVGKDQIQHLEMTRDIAVKFNNEHGDLLTVPEAMVEESVATVPGIDGAKMSKSYGNTIEIFMEEKALQKRCNKIVTDSTPMGEALDPDTCNVYAIASLFLDEHEREELRARYRSGEYGYGHFKKELKELIWRHFAPAREKREYYRCHTDEVLGILEAGADRARAIASKKMEMIRECTGIL